MGKYKQGILEILSNHQIDDQHYVLSFDNDDLNPEPGQFIMLDCISQEVRRNFVKYNYQPEPLLMRPFSFYLSSTDGDLSIIYKIKEWGKGTGLLTNLKEGNTVAFRGPLGKPINMSQICSKEDTIHLVAGGVGIAPITFLAQRLIREGYKIYVYFGLKEVQEFFKYCLEDLESLGLNQDNIVISSEHISLNWLYSYDVTNSPLDELYSSTIEGYSICGGNMLQAFNMRWFNNIKLIKGPVFICAPNPVMKYIQEFVNRIGKECFCFMEEHMACGIGVCCGCNVNGHLICQEGPCINSRLIFGGELI